MEVHLVPLVFGVVGFLAGIGLLLVRVDPEQLARASRRMPGVALFRFPVFRYGAAYLCLAFGAVGIAAAGLF